ncbi:MAG TPA: hypothetical protein PLP29_10880 [Candidatus Ozemobacteraceae bacterium]|nr:hypothetical protein [Candidatus Ozemobacteraceae bacterium]
MLSLPELPPILYLCIWFFAPFRQNLTVIGRDDVLLFLGFLLTTALAMLFLHRRSSSRYGSCIGLTTVLVLSTQYGYLYNFFAIRKLLPVAPETLHGILLVFLGVAFALFFLALRKSALNLLHLIKILNVYLLTLTLLIAIEAASEIRSAAALPPPPSVSVSQSFSPPILSSGTFPDVYCLVLDGFARNDVLSELYSFDNSSFTAFLRDRGFYVAEQSTSNYPHTYLSLLALLEGGYVNDAFDRLFTPEDLARRMSANPTAASFVQHGYGILCFKNGRDSPNISPNAQFLTEDSLDLHIFTEMNLAYAIFPACASLVPHWVMDNIATGVRRLISPLRGHQDRIRFFLREVATAPKSAAPQFVFLHIICPHAPFVFDRDGRETTPPHTFGFNDNLLPPDNYIESYISQLQFLQNRICNVVEALQNRQRERMRPVVILLCSDHGPASRMIEGEIERTNLKERFSNLTAVYFPDQNYALMNPRISLVNLFRVVRSKLFGESLPLLENKNYFVSGKIVFPPISSATASLIDITDRLKP